MQHDNFCLSLSPDHSQEVREFSKITFYKCEFWALALIRGSDLWKVLLLIEFRSSLHSLQFDMQHLMADPEGVHSNPSMRPNYFIFMGY